MGVKPKGKPDNPMDAGARPEADDGAPTLNLQNASGAISGVNHSL
jgi:hypothetical protein